MANRYFEVHAVDHVGFAVPSLDDATRFWTQALGATLVRTGQMSGHFLEQVTGASDASVRMAIVEIAGRRIELLEYEHAAPRDDLSSRPYNAGALHLAIQVSDIDAVIEAVRDHGWHPQGLTQTIDAGERAGTRVMYIVGPAGSAIELMQPPRRHR